MNKEETISALENLATKLGVTVRYEDGDFRGDLCKVEDEKIIVVKKKVDLDKKVETLARGLSRIDVRNVYILPELRELIEPQESAGEKFGLNGD